MAKSISQQPTTAQSLGALLKSARDIIYDNYTSPIAPRPAQD